ncbi:MAG: hypothetical protein KC910_14840, partial [Candidatus Eremiobacteraeota bacterium]|nr:hypothetical protein [Candidatus Eremiobacteraeota bacterium]
GMERQATYPQLAPLVRDIEVDRKAGQVRCIFVCPVTGRRVPSSHYIEHSDGVVDSVLDGVSTSFWYNLRRRVFGTVVSYFNPGLMRDVVEGTANSLLYRGDERFVSEAEVQAGVVKAFEAVRHEFEWGQQGWVAREVVEDFSGDFHRQMREFPIQTRYEAVTLGRVLGAVARLEGVAQSELSFLWQFGSPLGGDAEANLRSSPPSSVELSEVAPEAKATLLMLAWTLALVDEQLSPSERSYLKSVAEDLGLGREAEEAMQAAARQFVIEQLVDLDQQPDRAALKQMAQRLGYSLEEFERVVVRLKKRQPSP